MGTFMAQVHINGSSRVTEVGIIFESELTKQISFSFDVDLDAMQRKILRRIHATSSQNVTSTSYRWINETNTYGQYYYEVRIYDDEDLKEMLMGMRMQRKDFVEIMATVEDVERHCPLNEDRNDPARNCFGFDLNYFPTQQSIVQSEPDCPSLVPSTSYQVPDSNIDSHTTLRRGNGMEQIIQMMTNPTINRESERIASLWPSINESQPCMGYQHGATSSHDPPIDVPFVNPDDPYPEDQFDEASDSDYEAALESDSDEEADLHSWLVADDEQYRHPMQPPEFFTSIGDDHHSGDYLPDLNVPIVSIASELHKGLEWKDKKPAVCFIKEWSIENNVEFKVAESNLTTWLGRCVFFGNGCEWELRMSLTKKTGMWTVKEVIAEHTCRRARLSQYHRNLDSELISYCIRAMVEKDPTIPIPNLCVTVREKYKYDVRYKTVWRAKQIVLNEVFGEFDSSYNQLPKFIQAMRDYVPGSVFVLEETPAAVDGVIDPDKKIFNRLFWTFRQCREAFVHCKPFIQIDGTFLYGKYKEKLLIAVAQDGNKKIVPLAFAIVKNETTDDWAFFLRNLREHIAYGMGELGLISDRHATIISAII